MAKKKGRRSANVARKREKRKRFPEIQTEAARYRKATQAPLRKIGRGAFTRLHRTEPTTAP